MGRTSVVAHLPISVSKSAPESLPQQIVAQIRSAIGKGALVGRDTLPSSRSLANSLGISRGSVVSAYEQLQAEGYLETIPGGLTRVRTDIEVYHPDMQGRSELGTFRGVNEPVAGLSLEPGQPYEGSLANAKWRSAWRKGVELSTISSLPRALTEHLRHMRSVVVPAANVMVTSGARDGLATILHAFSLVKKRPARVGFESPGNPHLRAVAKILGHVPVPVGVDEAGPRVNLLDSCELDLLVVTPSHLYPAGASMPASRRFALLEWARARGVLIVEDDYDSELRHVSAPLPALAALDSGDDPHVILLGTFSTLLTPKMSAGWLSAPARLFDVLAKVRNKIGNPVSSITSQALADLIETGELARHTRRMRRLYRTRSVALEECLSQVPGVRILAQASGLNVALTSSSYPEGVLVERCAKAGLRVRGLHEYWGSASWHVGLMLGVGALSNADYVRALDRLALACSDASEQVLARCANH
ncbi:transcriptional regulator, GntR family [Winkia neuii]|uniref:PLP-dependent aminotransferase family protein n=1 Tax=Winkia neuii TaxID=33007 RepID=A0A2I1ING1_9ACTO|nr:PLP-dependent aminotransferase family protein [Winkia neuii]KWZ73224.1 transcriptional regulator, GntR family [Winkia neuii]MDK8099100.1 PLP-dependent aminotransferase family protein [Winkia neuii]PKY72667.1 PLP-dependent aminotransferase family protein [Winkia neuii]